MALLRSHPEPGQRARMNRGPGGNADNGQQRRMSLASMRRRPLAID
jgi:hypothetical protein